MAPELLSAEPDEMTVLLDLPTRIADVLSSKVCSIEPYQGRQIVLGARQFVGSLEFHDGGLDVSAARRKTVMYTVSAYVSVSLGETEHAERLLVQLCHGTNSWHQLLRESGIVGVRPLDAGLNIERNKEDNRLTIAVSADIEVEIAAFVPRKEA